MDNEDNPLFRSDIEAVSNNLHPGSLTARLLKVAEPGNTRRNALCCSIRLCPEWPKMLHSLPALGRVLIATRNSGAVLGERRAYPAMRFGDNFLRAQSADGDSTLSLFRGIRHLSHATRMRIVRRIPSSSMIRPEQCCTRSA